MELSHKVMMLLNQMTNEELDSLDTKQFVEYLLNDDYESDLDNWPLPQPAPFP
jgi:hypothetical protein